MAVAPDDLHPLLLRLVRRQRQLIAGDYETAEQFMGHLSTVERNQLTADLGELVQWVDTHCPFRTALHRYTAST